MWFHPHVLCDRHRAVLVSFLALAADWPCVRADVDHELSGAGHAFSAVVNEQVAAWFVDLGAAPIDALPAGVATGPLVVAAFESAAASGAM